jgi:hypothetical protein
MSDSQLARFTARVSKNAYLRLAAACNRRYVATAQYTAFGAILTELIMEHLPEVPGEFVDIKPTKARGLAKTG